MRNTKPGKLNQKYVYPVKGGFIVKIGETQTFISHTLEHAFEIAVEVRDRFVKALARMP